LNYKYLVGKKVLSFFLSFIFVLVFVFLFFLFLRKINYGVFSIYEILLIIFGFILENLMYHMVEKKMKK